MIATRTRSLIASLTQTKKKKEDFCKQFIVQEVHKKHRNYSNDCDGTQIITLIVSLAGAHNPAFGIPLNLETWASFIIFLFVCFCVCVCVCVCV